MKKIITLLMAVTLTIGLTGCGLFSSSDSAEGEAAQGGAIALTDTFTHEDPEGLEFETRYALTTGKDNPEMVDAFYAEYGVDFVEQVAIIYADKDNKVCGEYDYYIFATPEDAQAFEEFFDAESRGGRVDGNVVAEFMDGEMVNMLIGINMQYNSMSEDTATAYVEFMKEVNLMITLN